ncbi:leucine-rich repeat domain-containing protein [Saccharicrinis aurantiacus]|uniref:leucine-rich repeat domain-containing protein n=1 Tax=Saccharicrinis aurantiacus TaxID=1849719 RepID=UPI0024936E5B|nr:leucine-rich repeat domain-containing protein [Saccharicrinis aurantiacus]
MKTIIFILLFAPLLVSGQSTESVIVYRGNGQTQSNVTDLSNKNLTKLPIIDTDVEVLILDDNNLTEIPGWFTSLKKLRTLSIRNNNLRDVDVLMYCENLEEIYLTNNENLEYLPSFGMCKKIKLVDVVNTKINELPMSIRGMNGLAYFKYSAK